jgi:hypothetical protein
MKLRAIAHSRTGDKGDTSNISVIAYREDDYAYLLEHVTAARVKAHLASVVRGEVERHELPRLFALNFVLAQALDAHGKSLSSALLDLELPERTRPNRRFPSSEGPTS